MTIFEHILYNGGRIEIKNIISAPFFHRTLLYLPRYYICKQAIKMIIFY
jgi:hypothetical protein